MRKLFTILLAVFLTATVWAQSPNKMSYQAVIRNASNNLVTGTAVAMRISILQGSTSGSAVYVETQTPTTNANGLVSIELGGGTVVSGNFSTINWANGPYFVKTETNPDGATGGIVYTITGISQLLSVPYALHAKTAESVSGTITETDPVFTAWDKDYADLINTPAAADGSETKVTAGTNVTITGSGTTASPYVVNSTAGGSGTHYLGEEYLGGIIFYLYTDATGIQKGLVVSKTETTATWSGSTLVVGADRTEDGAYNMNLMPADSPARVRVEALGTGWYLPSIDELSILWHNRFHVNKTARAVSSTLLSTAATYWSSTESNAAYAFGFYFNGGNSGGNDKTKTYSVRAVRAF